MHPSCNIARSPMANYYNGRQPWYSVVWMRDMDNTIMQKYKIEDCKMLRQMGQINGTEVSCRIGNRLVDGGNMYSTPLLLLCTHL